MENIQLQIHFEQMNLLVFLLLQKQRLFVLELNKKMVIGQNERFLFLGQCEERMVWTDQVLNISLRLHKGMLQMMDGKILHTLCICHLKSDMIKMAMEKLIKRTNFILETNMESQISIGPTNQKMLVKRNLLNGYLSEEELSTKLQTKLFEKVFQNLLFGLSIQQTEKKVFLERMVQMERHLKRHMFLQEHKKILVHHEEVVFQNLILQQMVLLMEIQILNGMTVFLRQESELFG